MSRILDLTPSSEDSVVSRVLLLVHKAVDENFPKAEKPDRQFSKTVFSEDVVERTGQIFVPGERREGSQPSGSESGLSQVGGNVTGRGASAHGVPLHPDGGGKGIPTIGVQSGEGGVERRSVPVAYETPFHQGEIASKPTKSIDGKTRSTGPWDEQANRDDDRYQSRKKPLSSNFKDEEVTRLEDTFGLMNEKLETNWVSKVTIAFMIAGLILFIYVLLW